MPDATIITTVLTSTVIAALISSFVVKSNNDKTMSLKYITEERANWRKTIKEVTSKLYAEVYAEKPDEDKIKEMVTYLIVSLNPIDDPKNKLDLKIASLLKNIEQGQRDKDTLFNLRYFISVQLKHDWERSKNETKGFFTKLPDDDIKAKTLGDYYVPEQKKTTD